MIFTDFMTLFNAHLGKDQKITEEDIEAIRNISLFFHKNKNMELGWRNMERFFKRQNIHKRWKDIQEWRAFIINTNGLILTNHTNLLLIRRFTEVYSIRFGILIKKQILLKWIYPTKTIPHYQKVVVWYDSRYQVPLYWSSIKEDNDNLFFKNISMFGIDKNLDIKVEINPFNGRVCLHQKYPTSIKNISKYPFMTEEENLEDNNILFEKRNFTMSKFAEAACLLKYFFIQIQALEKISHALKK